MSHYTMTPGQTAYLQQHYIREAGLRRCCDCQGCIVCKGFVTGCGCDEMTLSEIYAYQEDHGVHSEAFPY